MCASGGRTSEARGSKFLLEQTLLFSVPCSSLSHERDGGPSLLSALCRGRAGGRKEETAWWLGVELLVTQWSQDA